LRLVIITQNDSFFIPESLDYLIQNLKKEDEVVAAIVSDVSPFGKKEILFAKALKTFKIFGLKFFLFYSLKFIIHKYILRRSVIGTLYKRKIKIIELTSSINSEESLELIRKFNPDLLLSIASNEIFKEQLFNLAKFGCLNLHTGMLPEYRGLMPSFWAMKNNEKYIGVSVFMVDEGIDSGPILVQTKLEIGNLTQDALIKLTKKIGMNCILEAIELIRTQEYEVIENSDGASSYYSFPKKVDVVQFRKSGKKFF